MRSDAFAERAGARGVPPMMAPLLMSFLGDTSVGAQSSSAARSDRRQLSSSGGARGAGVHPMFVPFFLGQTCTGYDVPVVGQSNVCVPALPSEVSFGVAGMSLTYNSGSSTITFTGTATVGPSASSFTASVSGTVHDPLGSEPKIQQVAFSHSGGWKPLPYITAPAFTGTARFALWGKYPSP